MSSETSSAGFCRLPASVRSSLESVADQFHTPQGQHSRDSHERVGKHLLVTCNSPTFYYYYTQLFSWDMDGCSSLHLKTPKKEIPPANFFSNEFPRGHYLV